MYLICFQFSSIVQYFHKCAFLFFAKSKYKQFQLWNEERENLISSLHEMQWFVSELEGTRSGHSLEQRSITPAPLFSPPAGAVDHQVYI
jgi:hypothetical protein